MMFDLTDRVALVTGASRGIGRAIALKLASQGATVVAAGRAGNAAATAAAITEQGGRAEAVDVDVTDSAALAQLPGTIVKGHGRLDVVVSNAGITRDQLLMRMKREEWDAVIATNLTAMFTLAQAAMRPMLKQRGGRIIAVSSVVGQMGNAGQTNYAASKAGLIGFAKALAREVASRGITVNVIAPGMIDTDMTRAISDTAHVDWAAEIPLGRLGTVDEVAAAACYLASDEAAYITGQVLTVNGGMYMLFDAPYEGGHYVSGARSGCSADGPREGGDSVREVRSRCGTDGPPEGGHYVCGVAGEVRSVRLQPDPSMRRREWR
jgi:3-oxoacyl-[acyl-carrier protein] reductase